MMHAPKMVRLPAKYLCSPQFCVRIRSSDVRILRFRIEYMLILVCDFRVHLGPTGHFPIVIIATDRILDTAHKTAVGRHPNMIYKSAMHP